MYSGYGDFCTIFRYHPVDKSKLINNPQGDSGLIQDCGNYGK